LKNHRTITGTSFTVEASYLHTAELQFLVMIQRPSNTHYHLSKPSTKPVAVQARRKHLKDGKAGVAQSRGVWGHAPPGKV